MQSNKKYTLIWNLTHPAVIQWLPLTFSWWMIGVQCSLLFRQEHNWSDDHISHWDHKTVKHAQILPYKSKTCNTEYRIYIWGILILGAFCFKNGKLPWQPSFRGKQTEARWPQIRSNFCHLTWNILEGNFSSREATRIPVAKKLSTKPLSKPAESIFFSKKKNKNQIFKMVKHFASMVCLMFYCSMDAIMTTALS